ncbi:MAG: hypothetical protein GXY23_07680 [Myxococcales bacterium]|jgi:hypothetical protein|nr:hypothetical protein [Myxococcales bacterium]
MRKFLIALSVVTLFIGAAHTAEAQSSKAPEGFWVGGGLHAYAGGWVAGGNPLGIRVEGGLPIGPVAIVLPLTIDARHGGKILTIAPGVQYEYRFEQINMPGLLSIFGEAGLGFFTVHPHTRAGGLLRVNVGARYYMEKVRGLYFNLNPIGFSAFMRDHGGAAYEFMMGAGYRFE